jgi:hypothetical protein
MDASVELITKRLASHWPIRRVELAVAAQSVASGLVIASIFFPTLSLLSSATKGHDAADFNVFGHGTNCTANVTTSCVALAKDCGLGPLMELTYVAIAAGLLPCVLCAVRRAIDFECYVLYRCPIVLRPDVISYIAAAFVTVSQLCVTAMFALLIRAAYVPQGHCGEWRPFVLPITTGVNLGLGGFFIIAAFGAQLLLWFVLLGLVSTRAYTYDEFYQSDGEYSRVLR